MKRTTVVIGAMLLSGLLAHAQKIDTLRLSTLYTTHVIFPTELIYADLSNSRIVAAKIIDQNKNMLAIKAREPFTTSASVSALESGGAMHTYVLVYDEHPEKLVIDERLKGNEQEESYSRGKNVIQRKEVLQSSATQSAPALQDVVRGKQRLFHIGDKAYDLTFLCKDVFVYRDNSYLVLSISNRSAVSYEAVDATFVIESRRKGKRTVQYEKNLQPKGRHGSVCCAPGSTSSIVYTFDKITLTKDQVLRVYLYETGGQRNLVMTFSPNDLNKAVRWQKTRSPSTGL